MDRLRIVCFDLGGVLLQIRHTWDEICEHLGVPGPPNGPHPLNGFSAFREYQAGSIDAATYLQSLSGWFGGSVEEAEAIHGAILVADYPGAFELVGELEREGIFTCCFSNTNDLHWPVLCDPVRHPAIGALRRRIASHEIGLAKPDPASYRAVEKLTPAGAEIVFFDDSAENVAAANREGWTAFRVDPSKDPVRQVRSALEGLPDKPLGGAIPLQRASARSAVPSGINR